MDLKGRLVLVLLTVQTCGTNKQKDYVRSSPFHVNPASAPTLSGLLGFRIPNIMYLLYKHILIVNQAPEKKKPKNNFWTLRPPTVNEPVIIWVVLMDWTISVLSEIQNYFFLQWFNNHRSEMMTTSNHGTLPTNLSQSYGMTSSSTFSSLLLSHFISLSDFFQSINGERNH